MAVGTDGCGRGRWAFGVLALVGLSLPAEVLAAPARRGALVEPVEPVERGYRGPGEAGEAPPEVPEWWSKKFEPKKVVTPPTPEVEEAGDGLPLERMDYGGIPLISFDSDLGFGFGAIASIAKFDRNYNPYRWRLEILLSATVKRRGDGVEVPFHDDYLNWDLPGLLDGLLRLSVVGRYRRQSNSGYYGLGNNAGRREEVVVVDPEEELGFREVGRYYEYDRYLPSIDINGRFKLWDRSTSEHKRRLELLVGSAYYYNFLNVYEDSKLEEDIAIAREDSEDGRKMARLLQGTTNHSMFLLNLGLIVDTRDHEFVPTRGTFTELSMRFSPGVQDNLLYAGFTASTAWFFSLYKDYFVIAPRVLLDNVVGNAPFYNFSQFGSLFPRTGPGGSFSVRGVRRQRYHGKIKAIGNIELRSMFWHFNVKKQKFHVGAVLFADASHIWADYKRISIRDQYLDAEGANFAVGLGGGARLQWGETFIIRFDPSYSPTNDNFALYFDFGQLF